MIGNPIRQWVLAVNNWGYRALRGFLFMQHAQIWHERILDLLAHADDSDLACAIAEGLHRVSFRKRSYAIGGVQLAHPFILAAGFVKGHGFYHEGDAMKAVEIGMNIIPGWKSMPRLVGLVEYGSFTRQPRIGNSGTVMWRDAKTQSTQNRVGLRNPGVEAAASFMLKNIMDMPHTFGINIAVSPGVDDEQAVIDVAESFDAFLKRSVVPNWFTLNISCPNTEDDPTGNQTEQVARSLCEAALKAIEAAGYDTPLWVKLSPDLAESQYQQLMRVFAEIGVQAVIATNTLGQPAPHHTKLQAGLAGRRLHPHALKVAQLLYQEAADKGYAVDVIGCGGVLNGDSYLAYKARGIPVVQYWSALVFRGPLAAAIIESEFA